MRIAVCYGPMCLMRSPKETMGDPRTGSEIGFSRIGGELSRLGHNATMHCAGNPRDDIDVAIAINEPDRLRDFPNAKLRICMFWLNEFSFCKEGFDDYVDLYFSPSEAHRQKAIGDWGAPVPSKWSVNYLGCDVPRPNSLATKASGRVVYCSSPDRGLHRVLGAWPEIKRRLPHASLKVFYRLEPWFRGFDSTPFFPPIERLRHRALWCEEALRRMSGPEWGITVVDSVSHDELMREMAQAEVLLHPCETTSWSEGFSVTVLEGCAAGACPIISDCDALGEVYADLDPVPVGQWGKWRDDVVRALTDPAFRAQRNEKARALAEKLTWARHVKQLDEVIRGAVKNK
jgi:glycosyltransferase involved in cell wall biosynthesis